MSVWLEPRAEVPSLAGSGGILVCVTVDVDARDLERLLEALAGVEFPINPQIYHEAAVRYLFADGTQREHPVTLVEFPAYEGQIEEVRGALLAHDFSIERMHVSEMLGSLHSEGVQESTLPAGLPCRSRVFLRHRAVHAAG